MLKELLKGTFFKKISKDFLKKKKKLKIFLEASLQNFVGVSLMKMLKELLEESRKEIL